MSYICNYCGALIPDGAEVCPQCGMPTVHAPHAHDKKFWEEDQESTSTPPPFFGDDSVGTQQTPPYTIPQPEDHAKSQSRRMIIEPLKKRTVNKVVLIVAVVLVLTLLIIGYQEVKNASKPSVSSKSEQIASEKQPESESEFESSDSSFVIQEITGEEADSIMNANMEEMRKMEQMMEEMMGNDPFADFDNAQSLQEQPNATRSHKPTNGTTTAGKIKMAGNVGRDHYVMVLNVKDQNNITGTAATLVDGKERNHYRLLGIGSGKDLTVSVYDRKNKIVGTLSGTYDGYVFSGIYTTDNGETQFQMVSQ